MSYVELPGGGPHVACLWMSEGTGARRVLPDACVDVVWTGERLVVAGPATGPVLTAVPAGTAAVGVRFRVGAAGAALGLPAAELLDATVALEDVWGTDGRRLAERVGAAPTPAAALGLLAAAVDDRLARAAAPDPAVRASALGVNVSLGERHLRRRFAAAVGYGPATLRRILRFQRFLALAHADAALASANVNPRRSPAPTTTATANLARLALDAGYADQAHLTRECTRLAGLPPAALLAAGAGPAGESVSFKTAAGETASIGA